MRTDARHVLLTVIALPVLLLPVVPLAGAQSATEPDNAFNPAIGIVLNGMFSGYSAGESEIPGFPSGHLQKRKRPTVAKWSTRRWPPDSIETVSGTPGANQ